MGDSYHCGTSEFLPDNFLDKVIGFHVNIWGSLVENQEFIFWEKSSSQAKKLFLTDWKTFTFLWNLCVQLVLKLYKEILTVRMWSLNPDCARTSQSSSSLAVSKGSRFNLMVPLKMKGVWGMTDKCWRRECRPIWRTLLPSISYTDPLSGSMILKSAWMKDDLPAPVLPTIPTFYPAFTLKDTSLRISGRFYRYRADRFFISR